MQNDEEKQTIKLLEEIKEIQKGILLAIALKEEKRDNQVKILKAGGLNKTEIVDSLGPSGTTLRTRKHKEKKKQERQKGFLSKLGLGGEK